MSTRFEEPQPQYDYEPNLGAGIFFTIAFSLLTLTSLFLVVKSRIWWLVVLLIGGVGEILGWAGRVWSAENLYSRNAFLIQIVCLIISPSFFSATLYGLLGMVIRYVGPSYSIIGPKWYLIIFMTADVLAIVIQLIGGAMASSDDRDTSKTGTDVMVGGIAIQLAAMVIFCFFAAAFYLKQRKRTAGLVPGERLGLMFVVGILWTSVWILIRCIYRMIELSQGWHGELLTHEAYFFALDAVPMLLTMAGFVAAWPTRCLPNAKLYVSSKALGKHEAGAEYFDGVPTNTTNETVKG